MSVSSGVVPTPFRNHPPQRLSRYAVVSPRSRHASIGGMRTGRDEQIEAVPRGVAGDRPLALVEVEEEAAARPGRQAPAVGIAIRGIDPERLRVDRARTVAHAQTHGSLPAFDLVAIAIDAGHSAYLVARVDPPRELRGAIRGRDDGAIPGADLHERRARRVSGAPRRSRRTRRTARPGSRRGWARSPATPPARLSSRRGSRNRRRSGGRRRSRTPSARPRPGRARSPSATRRGSATTCRPAAIAPTSCCRPRCP